MGHGDERNKARQDQKAEPDGPSLQWLPLCMANWQCRGSAKSNAAHLIEAVEAVGGDLARAIIVGDADTDAGAVRGCGGDLQEPRAALISKGEPVDHVIYQAGHTWDMNDP